jgi:hypothetical protein
MNTDIGFTGTQGGMTIQQVKVIETILGGYDPESTAVHLGDCIGADDDCWHIADAYRMWLFGHPPVNHSKRAFCKYHFIAEEKEYIERNHDIVDASDLLLATPGESQEQLRSGTWATIRYGRNSGLDGIVVLPDGTCTDLHGTEIVRK